VKDLGAFEKIAPHLTHPLVLAGFALFVLFSLLYALLSSDKLSPLGKTQSSRLLERVVLGGSVVAGLVIVLGFALAFSRSPSEPDVYRLRVTVLAPDGAFELPSVAPEGDMVRLRVAAEGFRVFEEHVLAGGRAKRLELKSEEGR